MPDPTRGAWAAPGRVNLIGEHTDYNDGFVLPIALSLRTSVTAARRQDNRVTVRSRQPSPGWERYVTGVLSTLGVNGGLDVEVDSQVPIGSGLSSSAALECAVALAANDLFSLGRSREELAVAAQRAENEVVGVPCGVMDQLASLCALEGHALLLDCRTLERSQIPLDLGAAGLALLVIDTRAPRRLVAGEYATRRRQCEQAAALLGVDALRDASVDDVGRLHDATLRRRARHVVAENGRVLGTAARLRAGELQEIGPVLTASHQSLRDDFEVSCPELDEAVDAALAAGALGARMTGGGFGGCAIALIGDTEVDVVVGAVAAAFGQRGFHAPHCFTVEPAAGAARVA